MFTTKLVSRCLALVVVVICVSPYSFAENLSLTAFGGVQHNGKLTFQSAPSTTTNFVQTFDPQTFGVFGVRFVHGKLIEGEHTVAYAPNFLDSNSHGVIYHSNLRVQPSIWILKPYATAGIGLVSSGGDALSSFGTKFAFNYGGGADITFGHIGVNMDLRGYGVPKVTIEGFSGQERMDFYQASVGVVIHF